MMTYDTFGVSRTFYRFKNNGHTIAISTSFSDAVLLRDLWLEAEKLKKQIEEIKLKSKIPQAI